MITNEVEIRVTYADTDQMGVAYYARYFEYFERGRAELLRNMGTPYSKMEGEGVKMPVIEAYCKYLKGARYDEVIRVKTFLKNLPKARVRIEYEVCDESGEDVLATGYTVHSFINDKGRPTKPPLDFVEVIGEHLKAKGRVYGRDGGNQK